VSDAYADITDHDPYLNDVPHATFERLRRDESVAWVEEKDGSGFWGVMRYDDVCAVSKDYGRSMMEYDPPEHRQLRRIVQPSFSRKTVLTYEAAFREITRKRLDAILERREFDLVTEIARELPIRILCRLLGVPDDDADKLVDWGDQMIANADPEYSRAVVDQVDTDEYRLLPFRCPAGLELCRYAEKVALDRREHSHDDVLTQLLPLTDLEFQNVFALLMVAGKKRGGIRSRTGS